MREYIYGPVPSRRLGFSLGVDLVPYKVCTYDCIYCQLGKTTNKTIQRKEYIESREVLLQIKKAISTQQKIDYITFSGSGEPTLNTNIGSLIREIKKITDIPVVVITNGSLLYKESIRKALLPADLVVPSLDAAT
ncbi:radical SAM protein, partial [candidate division WOR-3 bacterium]|nr:radical SAM protein [candidate division WOR-3 bacterium]